MRNRPKFHGWIGFIHARTDERKVAEFEVEVVAAKFIRYIIRFAALPNGFELFVDLWFGEQGVENVQDWVDVPCLNWFLQNVKVFCKSNVLRLFQLVQIFNLFWRSLSRIGFVKTKSLELIDKLIDDVPEPKVWLKNKKNGKRIGKRTNQLEVDRNVALWIVGVFLIQDLREQSLVVHVAVVAMDQSHALHPRVQIAIVKLLVENEEKSIIWKNLTIIFSNNLIKILTFLVEILQWSKRLIVQLYLIFTTLRFNRRFLFLIS